MATVDDQVDAILQGRCPRSSAHLLGMFTTVETSGARRVGVECLHSCGLKVSLPWETVQRLILREVAEHDAFPVIEGSGMQEWDL